MPSISCTEFSRLLEQAVESRLPADAPELRGHAAECADCRAVWVETLLLDSALAQWKNKQKCSAPSVDLTDVILFRRTADQEAAISVADSQLGMAGVSGDVQSGSIVEFASVALPAAATVSKQPRRWLTRRTAALAATVLATAVCVAFLSGRLSRRESAIETAHRSAADLSGISSSVKPRPAVLSTKQANGSAKRATPPSSSPNARRIADSPVRGGPTTDAPVEAMVQDAGSAYLNLADAGSAYLNLASEAAQAVAAATVLVPRPGAASETAPAVEENVRWVDDVSREFEPVSKNLSQAFEFLLEAVPTEKAPAT
jgi:hypothetical protein